MMLTQMRRGGVASNIDSFDVSHVTQTMLLLGIAETFDRS